MNDKEVAEKTPQAKMIRDDNRPSIDITSRPKCPECGSNSYIQGTYSESCRECGCEASYW